MEKEYYKTIKCQRLCVDDELKQGGRVVPDAAQFHYLKNVLRLPEEAPLRVFNGRDGEWLAALSYTGKKGAALLLQELLKPQPAAGSRRVHLAFAPIKKNRMDFLVEKAVELGAHALHPVLTQNTEVRTIREDRISLQIREAAEQCERLDIPSLLPLQKMEDFIKTYRDMPVLACLERADARPLSGEAARTGDGDLAILVGPEGGFTAGECDILRQMDNVIPVSLGHRILRSETAALSALSLVM